MTPQQKQFLRDAFKQAQKAGHIFPEHAACEAALESGYGRSVLAVQARNFFGMKAHQHQEFGICTLPTNEFYGGQWKQVTANWVEYPDVATCFADRMATLRRLAPVYPHYAAALAAGSGTTYVTEVSRTWSTDPKRAEKVLAIYDQMAGDWNAIDTQQEKTS